MNKFVYLTICLFKQCVNCEGLYLFDKLGTGWLKTAAQAGSGMIKAREWLKTASHCPIWLTFSLKRQAVSKVALWHKNEGGNLLYEDFNLHQHSAWPSAGLTINFS